MYANLSDKLFQPFLEKNSFLKVNSRVKNYTINSYDFSNIANILSSENILLNNMVFDDIQQFNKLRNSLVNKNIKNNLTSIYCLLFNECVNINNELQQKKLICSSLKKYLSNILIEINDEILSNLDDKCLHNNNYSKSQKNKANKNDLKITLELMFLIFVFMINKYKNIINSTNENCVIKGINIRQLKSNQVKEELYFILIIQQNLYWMDYVIDCLKAIFKNLKNNKFRLLVNADTEFNNLDENFKNSCFNCFLSLFSIIKKYSSIKSNSNSHFTIIDYIFDRSSICVNMENNGFLPLRINSIDKIIFKLYECFIYEFLYNIDSLWKYFDGLNFSILDKSCNNNSEILYGFGIYLCNFIKYISFIRNDNTTKIDFFNFYIFSYNLMTKYFSKLNRHLFDLFISLKDIIKNNYIISHSNVNLNYLQYLSNTLKDMIYQFMIFSFYNDSLKDIYTYNEILINSLISHCFLKIIIPIYFIIIHGNKKNILLDILNILIENVNKYKIILPLKCHFHKELITHNILLVLEYFLINFEEEIINFLKERNNDKEINILINNIKMKMNKTLFYLFDHYNCINFIYSNHIMFMFNKILDNSGLNKNNKFKNTSNDKRIENIILRYIPSDKNILNYIDIRLDSFEYFDSLKKSNDMNSNSFNFIEPLSNLNPNDINFDNDLFLYYNTYEGFSLEENFNKNIIELLSQIDIEGYKFNVINGKYYLIKNKIMNEKVENSYSNILVNNGEFIEIMGIDKNLKENILEIMENIDYTDKCVFKLIQEKVINSENRHIKVSHNFYKNLKYYDLEFKMNYFEYQNQIKHLLL